LEVGQNLRQRADNLEAEIDERRHRQENHRNHHHDQCDRAPRQGFSPIGSTASAATPKANTARLVARNWPVKIAIRSKNC